MKVLNLVALGTRFKGIHHEEILVVFVLFTPICMRAATPTISDSLDILHHTSGDHRLCRNHQRLCRTGSTGKVDGMDLFL